LGRVEDSRRMIPEFVKEEFIYEAVKITPKMKIRIKKSVSTVPLLKMIFITINFLERRFFK
tara:strand:+ start:77 stop:259 length:183 start_codon:yes stop_codon:yes gene_type:complete